MLTTSDDQNCRIPCASLVNFFGLPLLLCAVLCAASCGSPPVTEQGAAASAPTNAPAAASSSNDATFNFSGQSCRAFAPEDQVTRAAGQTIRFNSSSTGGNESIGWGCWFFTGSDPTNSLLIDAYGDIEQGRRMTSPTGGSTVARADVAGLTGEVYESGANQYNTVYVLRDNGFFYVQTSPNDRTRYPDSYLSMSQVESIARVVNAHLTGAAVPADALGPTSTEAPSCAPAEQLAAALPAENRSYPVQDISCWGDFAVGLFSDGQNAYTGIFQRVSSGWVYLDRRTVCAVADNTLPAEVRDLGCHSN